MWLSCFHHSLSSDMDLMDRYRTKQTSEPKSSAHSFMSISRATGQTDAYFFNSEQATKQLTAMV